MSYKRKEPCEICGSMTSDYWPAHARCSWRCEREWYEAWAAAHPELVYAESMKTL